MKCKQYNILKFNVEKVLQHYFLTKIINFQYLNFVSNWIKKNSISKVYSNFHQVLSSQPINKTFIRKIGHNECYIWLHWFTKFSFCFTIFSSRNTSVNLFQFWIFNTLHFNAQQCWPNLMLHYYFFKNYYTQIWKSPSTIEKSRDLDFWVFSKQPSFNKEHNLTFFL